MKYFYHICSLLVWLSFSLSAQEKAGTSLAQKATAAEKDALPENEKHTPNPKEETDEEPVSIKVEPNIFDEREILSAEQVSKIKEVQQAFYKNYQCVVSYGFYDGHIPSLSVRKNWKDMIAQDEKRQFHIFLNIGVLRTSNLIDIYYRYPPPLKNMSEIDTVLANLKRDLQSETGLDALLERSYEAVNDELGYLGKKTDYESHVQEEVNAFEASQLKEYLFKIIKITAFILVPIIALLIIWSIFSRLRNKLPYRFPDVKYVQRFGSTYSATSITKLKK